MSIYDINGNALSSVRNIDGTLLSQANDVSGNIIWTSSPNTIKVMTYNVGGWYIGSGTNVPADKDVQYYNLQHGMIVDNNPDVLILQEYWTTFSQAGRSALTMLQDLFPYVTTVKGTDQWYGHAICSKYPLTGYTEHIYSNSAKRYYDSCTITVGTTPITVVNTHLDVNSQSARVEQINQLITFLQSQTRFIACGDLNTVDCKNTSGADYTAIITPLLNAGFHLANCSTFGFLETYSDEPVDSWTGCLDNIITSSNLTITNAYVDTTKLTDNLADKVDHMPLIATIEL